MRNPHADEGARASNRLGGQFDTPSPRPFTPQCLPLGNNQVPRIATHLGVEAIGA